MRIDPRVRRRYELFDEDERLWRPGRGDLVRLRSWDIFDRVLPEHATIADVGGGPGTHAAYLARQGHDVLLLDPVPRHVPTAAARCAAQPGTPYRVGVAEARRLPLADGSVDAVLLMGPLYHLVKQEDRLAALAEAARVLRPGGYLLAEVISRYAWLLDATLQHLLAAAGTWDDVDWSLRTGLSQDPQKVVDGSFWAYFHRPDELMAELELAGFAGVRLFAVEGFAWLLGDLPERMAEPAELLRALRLAETEPSMLGASAHILGAARLDPAS